MIRTVDAQIVSVLARYERSGRTVNAVFRKYLAPGNFSVVIAGDFAGAAAGK